MKFKRILAALLAVTVVGANMPAVSMKLPKISMTANAEGIESNLKYKTLDDDTIEITYCVKTVTTVEIPAEIDGKKVTSIGDYAFDSCSRLTSIVIPDSVTSIGYLAFGDCSSLTSITIPDSVTSIESRAFYACSGLMSITISDSVTSIGDYAFAYCSGLTSITIPDGVTSISDWAFAYCSGLTSITIPDSVTSISDYAFYTCSGLTSVTVPNSVTSIGDSAFERCSRLTSITILDLNCEINGNSTISNGYDNGYYFNGTIYGYENSTAQAYAEKYNRKFESLGEAPATEIAMGDINGDNSIDSSDAAVVLVDYALTSTGKESPLTDAQKAAADIDKDGKIDASDASYILQFYSYISTGGTETDMSKWMNK